MQQQERRIRSDDSKVHEDSEKIFKMFAEQRTSKYIIRSCKEEVGRFKLRNSDVPWVLEPTTSGASHDGNRQVRLHKLQKVPIHCRDFFPF
jgi:hypothetical protein